MTLDCGRGACWSHGDVLGMTALASRVSALSDVLEQGKLVERMRDEDSRMAMVEAACSATLREQGGRPSFQLLDFLAHLERARGKTK